MAYFEFLKSLAFSPPATPGTTGSLALSAPSGVAYDLTQNLVWVVDTNVVKAVSPVSLTTVYSISITSATAQLAYDPTQNYAWVNDSANNSLKGINAATGVLASTISVSGSPTSIAYDPTNNYVWTTYGGSTIACFNASTGASVATISASNNGQSISWDPVNNRLWYISTATFGNPALAYIPASTNTPTATSLTSTSAPLFTGTLASVYYDSLRDVVWVGDTGVTPDRVAKWDIATSTVAATLTTVDSSAASPVGFTLDGTGKLWVAWTISVRQYDPITTTAGSVAGYSAVSQLTYDSHNHRVWGCQTASPAGLYFYQLS